MSSDVVCSATYVRPCCGLHINCLQFLAYFELSLNYCNRFLTGVPNVKLLENPFMFIPLLVLFTFCTCCILRCLVRIVVSCLVFIVVVVLCVLL